MKYLSSQGKEPGIDYAKIDVIFPVLTSESNADTAIWLFPAIRYGLISREEGRSQLKFRGKPVDIDDIEFIDATATYLQEQALAQENDEPKNKSGQNENRDKD